jgi:glucose/arabinose dehydrogenase
MRRGPFVCVLVAAAFAVGIPSSAAAPPDISLARIKLTTIATGLTKPIAFGWRNGDATKTYVAEQTGRIVIVSGGHVTGTALTLTGLSTGAEQGLLGFAFSNNGTKLYVDYTGSSGDIHVVEFTMNGNAANTATRRELLLISHHTFANHNGGNLVMGPAGNLYIGTGDGGSAGDPAGNAQNLNSLLGKILRINPNPNGTAPYSIPPSNPFVGNANARPAIYMWGLRNPWRYSLDRLTGDMWIGDVGQSLWEEVDYAPAGLTGVNWGWNKREGFVAYNGGAKPPGSRDPILVRSHSNGDCAIIGGFVYRGTAIQNFNGAYVFGDECTGKLRAVVQQGGVVQQSRDLLLTVPTLSSFGQGPAGEIFAASLGGTLYRLAPA